METLEVKKITENNIYTIEEETFYVLDEINKFVYHNDYRFNKYPFNLFNHCEISIAIFELSLNQLKKLKRKINHFRLKNTLKSANNFLYFFYKKVMNSEYNISILYPEKQLEINKKRQKYIIALNHMKTLYDDYKKEKGDYFKLRIKKKQNIE